MAIQIIDVGDRENDRRGDPIRDAFIKINQNFAEIETSTTGFTVSDLVTNLTTDDETKPAAANTVYDLKQALDAITLGGGYPTVVDDLTTGGATDALSADQGVALKAITDAITVDVSALESSATALDTRLDALEAGTYIWSGANDGSTDETETFAAALNAFKSVRIPPNTTVGINKQIIMPVGSRVVGSGKTSIIKALTNITLRQSDNAAIGDSGQAKCLLRATTGCEISNLTLEGNNLKAGGVMVWGHDDVLIENVWVNNAVGAANNDAAATSAVNCFNADRVTVRGLKVYRALYGVQFYECEDCQVYDSSHDVGRAGFWTTNCTNVEFHRVSATNMLDVGLDFEGGTDCYFFNSHASSCNNGELALFNGDPDGTGSDDSAADFRLKFVNCTARRTATYVTYAGTSTACSSGAGHAAMFVSSLSQASRECGWYGCMITTDFGRAFAFPDMFATSDANDWELEIDGCQFTHNNTGSLFRTNGYTRGVRISACTWTINAIVATSAEWKNPDRASFVGNTFICNAAPTAYLINVYQDAAPLSPAAPCLFARNVFGGPGANQYMVRHQQNNTTGADENFIYEENIFSDAPVPFGGLYIDNGARPIFRNQKLKILLQKATAGTTEAINMQTVADFAYLWGTTDPEMSPVATGLLYLNQRDAGTGVLSSSVRNIYPLVISYAGAVRLDAPDVMNVLGSAQPGTPIASGSATLATSGTTTTVTQAGITSDSIITLTPTNAEAAWDLPTTYITPGSGSFTITHSVNASSRTVHWQATKTGVFGLGSGSGLTRSSTLFIASYNASSSAIFNITKPTDAALNIAFAVELNSRPVLSGVTV